MNPLSTGKIAPLINADSSSNRNGIDSIDWTDIASIVATMPNGFKNNYLFVWAGLTVATAAIGAIIWIFAYRMTDAESKQYALENIEHDKKVRTASEVGTKS